MANSSSSKGHPAQPTSDTVPVAAREAPGMVQAVTRSLTLLNALADSPRARTLQELATEMGVSASTVHRLMSSLAAQHLAERDPITGRYRLGLGVVRLAAARARHVDLHLAAQPYLEALSDQFLETTSLWVRRGTSALCLAVVEGRRELRHWAEVGQAMTLSDLGAKSKILMSAMPPDELEHVFDDINWQFYGTTPAVVREELQIIRKTGVARAGGTTTHDLAAVAAGVRGHDGQIAAALAVAGASSRLSREVLERAESTVLEMAGDLSRELGYLGAPGDELASRHTPAPEDAQASATTPPNARAG